jgi:Pyruvate/2-oxoacid:ferredoxin oxidoreductase gamma subunit
MAEKGLKSNLHGAHDRTIILFDPGTVKMTFDSPGRKTACSFLEMALNEFNDRDAAMIIALGAVVEATKVFPWEHLEQVVEDWSGAEAWGKNRKALERGKELVVKG